MNKHNYLVTFLKKINLPINSLLKKYLNKINLPINSLLKKYLNKINLLKNSLLKKNLNKINLLKNFSYITRRNKFFLTLVVFIILFLSYLSIPHTYNEVKVQKELENQLLDKFKLNLNLSKDFNYNFFPRPHFTIKNSSIIENRFEIANIKKIYIFVSLNNLFSLNDIKIKDVILENSNFNFKKENSNFFTKLLDSDFLENNFIIKNSNVFFHNNKKEVLFINKIIYMKYNYDPKKLHNIVRSKNEIFNVPYSFKSYSDKNQKKIFSQINLNFLKLQINNEHYYDDNLKKGIIELIQDKKKSKISYELDKNFFIFKYFDKLNKPNFIYEGKIDLNPFFLDFTGQTNKLNLSPYFSSNSFFIQLLKTEIFNNKNLNIDLSINAQKIIQYHGFVDFFIESKIQEGLIDFDETKFSWRNHTDFEILNSLLYVSNNELILDGKLIVNIKDYNEIYKFLQISKNLRPELEKLEFNFNYNFDQQIMNFNNIKINGQISEKVNNVLEKMIFKSNKLQNQIYFKNILKKVIATYVG